LRQAYHYWQDQPGNDDQRHKGIESPMFQDKVKTLPRTVLNFDRQSNEINCLGFNTTYKPNEPACNAQGVGYQAIQRLGITITSIDVPAF